MYLSANGSPIRESRFCSPEATTNDLDKFRNQAARIGLSLLREHYCDEIQNAIRDVKQDGVDDWCQGQTC
ncbi:MAG TPA: hypothetical protein P5159_21765 [Phycisphaerae bacterium]|nr:hypothetical protein [Phycisphaerae bacterium]HSA29166.1 hypothetical protein [Phycisphaerae bacterium]